MQEGRNAGRKDGWMDGRREKESCEGFDTLIRNSSPLPFHFQMFDAIQKDANSTGTVAAGEGQPGFLMDTS